MGVLKDPNNIVGQIFGSLTVKEYVGLVKAGNRKVSGYRCSCTCGGEKIVPRSYLLGGRTKTCGKCREQKVVKENGYYRCITPSGKSFIFDEIDLPLVKSHNWWISSDDGYAMTWIDNRNVRFTRLQHVLSKNQMIDHIDGDRCNNRRSNERVVTKLQNNWNKGMRRNNTQGYVGIYYHRKNKNYVARIYTNRKYIHLGSYESKEEAARAYDEAARFYYGEFACVNFPREGEQCCRRNTG